MPSPTPSNCSPLQFREQHCSLAPTSRTRFWIAGTAPHLRSSNGGQPQPEDQDLQDPDVVDTWDLFDLNMHICMLWVCLSRAKGLLTIRNLNLTWLRCLSAYVPKTTLSLATPWGGHRRGALRRPCKPSLLGQRRGWGHRVLQPRHRVHLQQATDFIFWGSVAWLLLIAN